MSGASVRNLQTFLAENPAIYPQGEVTGYFGTLTLKAVQRFQSKYGIAKPGERVYGYVGPATRAKLNSLIEQSLSP
jgi:peptidoglycan hydrolase-like protein with peptidoglycan-binding domain